MAPLTMFHSYISNGVLAHCLWHISQANIISGKHANSPGSVHKDHTRKTTTATAVTMTH